LRLPHANQLCVSRMQINGFKISFARLGTHRQFGASLQKNIFEPK
jgi:hypothetical protein